MSSDDVEQNPFIMVSEALRSLSDDQRHAIVRSFLTGFGVFCIGGALAVGVFSDEVHDRFCHLAVTSELPQMMNHCEYISGLSWDIQIGLAAIAIVVLLTSEWIDRQYQGADDEKED